MKNHLKQVKKFNKILCILSIIFLTNNSLAQDFKSLVKIEEIPEFSLNSLGTEPIMPESLWAHSNAEDVLKHIKQIGLTPITPETRMAYINILSHDSTGNEIKDPTNTLKENTFLVERLKALFRLGALNPILNIIEKIDKNNQTEEIQKLKIQTLLLKGDTKKACALNDEMPQNTKTDQTRINCFLINEDQTKATLSYEIYRETKLEDDPLFTALADNVLLELPTPIPENQNIKTEHIFLAAKFKEHQKLKIEKLPINLKKTLIELPQTNIETRIQLAETLPLSSEEFQKIYNLPLFDLKITNTPLKRAELVQKINKLTSSQEKAPLIKEFIDLTNQDNLSLNLAPFLQTLVSNLSPEENLIYMAYNIAQIYALNNNLAQANPWREMLKKSTSKIHQEQFLFLTPLFHLLGAGTPKNIDELIENHCKEKISKKCTTIHAWFDETELILPDKPFTKAYMQESKNKKIGENLLLALQDLNKENTNKQEILNFIHKISPLFISRPLKREALALP